MDVTQIFRLSDDFKFEIEVMNAKLNKLKTKFPIEEEESGDGGDQEELRKENKKLKYRIGILEEAIKNFDSVSECGLPKVDETTKTVKSATQENKTVLTTNFEGSITAQIINVMQSAISKAYPHLDKSKTPCAISPGSGKVSSPAADYQFNSAMSIAGMLSKIGEKGGKKFSGREVAQNIIVNVKLDDSDKFRLIDRLEIAGPGFINIFINKKFYTSQTYRYLRDGVQSKLPVDRDSKKVIVEYSSPNIAKEMHVGHLRSTIIGDAIARLLEFRGGFRILRLNHVGDWGTQFGMLLALLKERYSSIGEDAPHWNDMGISDLQSLYKESKVRFDSDAAFKKVAYASVVSLQSHEAVHLQGWRKICQISRIQFDKLYTRLNVLKMEERGESYYQKDMERLVQDLKGDDHLQEDEGRLVMFGDDPKTIPMTIVKSDGGFTYDTSDLACLRQRVEVEKADWVIYVTDSGQTAHFDSLFACARKANFVRSSVGGGGGMMEPRIDHVTFGVVLGEDKKKLKTRSGESVKLKDLLDEGLRRAGEKLREKRDDAMIDVKQFDVTCEAVAYGCVKYADLSRNRCQDYTFSFDKMLDDRGNTAVYMLYAYTRIKSIFRKVPDVDLDDISTFLLKHLPNATSFYDDADNIHKNESRLMACICKFASVLDKVLDELMFHHLCEYMYELSGVFTDFYDTCYCIEKTDGEVKKIHYNRLALCHVTSCVLEAAFNILGLKTVTKM